MIIQIKVMFAVNEVGSEVLTAKSGQLSTLADSWVVIAAPFAEGHILGKDSNTHILLTSQFK